MNECLVPAWEQMLSGSPSAGSYIILSMFKFLFMVLSKQTPAPSFALVCLEHGEETRKRNSVFGSLPNPTQICSESTHRIWYKLKTKLGPRKTIRKERVSTPRETCPSRYWEQWGSLTPSGRSRVAGLDLRMLWEGPELLHCLLPAPRPWAYPIFPDRTTSFRGWGADPVARHPPL